MNILFIASESHPFIKTGSLGDVIFSLSKELRKLGLDVRVMIPKYGDIPEFFKDKMACSNIFSVPVGWRNQYCGLEELKYEGAPFYFIDNEYYFKRAGIYGFYDEAERYAFFCRAVLESIKYLDFKPDIIHCHDWQTGMVSALWHAHYKSLPEYASLKTVFTIHDLKHQGVFPKEILWELLNLGEEYFNIDGVEFFGGVSFMKSGLSFSNVITTLSSTYADEIQTPFFGERLDDLFRKRRNDLYGIMNGIDYNTYDPKTDRAIFANYSAENYENKKLNKTKLQELLGLEVNGDIPMVAVVSELTRQKGMDLIAYILDDILSMDLQLVILGMGEQQYENIFSEYAEKYPHKLSVRLVEDDILARKIYAASDLCMKPSLFEPCGIGQIMGMRYGCLPIIRETGGLKDTVKPYNEFTGEGNGFSFTHYNAHDLLFTVKRATDLYNERSSWDSIVKSAMNQDYSWRSSAVKYKKLYQDLTL
ncbi:MAG: glycogen synthase GlgA [Bacillota bacterium]